MVIVTNSDDFFALELSPGCQSSSDLQSWYSEAQKAAAQAVKLFKEHSWEVYGRRLDTYSLSVNEVF